MSVGAHPSEAVLARRAARRALIRRSLIVLVAVLVMLCLLHVVNKKENRGSAHVATKLVNVIKTEKTTNGIQVTARLDAPSPNGTSHQIEGVIAASAWAKSHVVWACYPANDPDKGVLRTPFDPVCSDLVANGK